MKSDKDKTQKLCFIQQAQEHFERLIEDMKQTGQLKEENVLEWVGRLNNVRACVRVCREGYYIHVNYILNGIIAFKQKDIIGGIVSISSFVLSLVFFVCFIMGHHFTTFP